MRAHAAALVPVALALLTGCAGKMAWRHPQHSDPQRFNVESMQCQQYAAQTAKYRLGGYDLATAILLGDRQAKYEAQFMECMQRLGYYLEREAPPQTPITAPAPVQPTVRPTTAPVIDGERATNEAECRRLWPDNREQFEICMRQ